MLELRGVHAGYGATPVLHGVDLKVGAKDIVALLGANGVGKSTTLRAISGLIKPTAGSITFNGKKISGLTADVIVRTGVSHCPEGRRVFSELTVEQNLKLGAYTRRDKQNVKDDIDETMERFPILRQRSKQLAGTLSGGEQQMLAIGRALMSKPQVLLMDEPSLGVAPLVVQQIFEIIKKINADGLSILLVEQNARLALGIAKRAYIMDAGEISLSGTAQELQNDDQVRKVYLGEG